MAESNISSEKSVAANFDCWEMVTRASEKVVHKVAGLESGWRRKAVLVEEFSEGAGELSRQTERV